MTDPKTALAGVMLEISFARFEASIATFSEERTPPRPFGRCDLISMTQVKAVARTRREVEGVNEDANPNKEIASVNRAIRRRSSQLWRVGLVDHLGYLFVSPPIWDVPRGHALRVAGATLLIRPLLASTASRCPYLLRSLSVRCGL